MITYFLAQYPNRCCKSSRYGPLKTGYLKRYQNRFLTPICESSTPLGLSPLVTSVSLHQVATIMDKSSWNTPRKKTCFIKRVSFSISNFHVSNPSPLFNVVTMWQCQWSVFQQWKGGEGGLANIKKDVFWNYGRTPIESVCFAQICQHFCPWLKVIHWCCTSRSPYPETGISKMGSFV